MLLKWLKHGRGDVKRAVNYVLKEQNHARKNRDKIIVVRGDPTLFERVCSSSRHSRRYKSAIIAFHPGDEVTPERIDFVLSTFEEVMASYGLGDPSRICYFAVYHQEGQNRHLHVLVATRDLETGKFWNPAPPGWEKLYSAWKRYVNTVLNFNDPDSHPAKATIKPIPSLQTFSEVFRKREELKHQITNLIWEKLREEYEQGNDVTRDTTIKYLRVLTSQCGGDIVRVGRNYISISLPWLDKHLRLTGGIYDSCFSTAKMMQICEQDDNKYDDDSKIVLTEKLKKNFELMLNENYKKHSKRYFTGGIENERGENKNRRDRFSIVPDSREIDSKKSEIARIYERIGKQIERVRNEITARISSFADTVRAANENLRRSLIKIKQVEKILKNNDVDVSQCFADEFALRRR